MKISLATTRNEKALANMQVEAARPRFELNRVIRDGITCLEASVTNVKSNPELNKACQRVGMDWDLSGQDRLVIDIYSNEELDAVRNPLKRFFVKA